MSEPKRIQRKRTKDWEMPDGAVYVGRGKGAYGKWGNPIDWAGYPAHWTDEDGDAHRVPDERRRHYAMVDFKALVVCGIGFHEGDYPSLKEIRRELAGKTLACWCPDDNCHATVLLEIANCPDEKFAKMLANHGRW